MAHSNVAALELGFAFSDPVADGPVIQAATAQVLKQNFTVEDALTQVRMTRALNEDMPIGLLVYLNMVMARGAEQFFKDVAGAGVDGVLIADMPPEMADEVSEAAKAADVALIFIISPLTDENRLRLISRYAGGFLYAVSRLGITGVDERVDDDLQNLIQRAKSICELPVLVGFGISSPQHAANMVALGADGVITGSKVLQLVEQRETRYISETLRPFFEDMIEAVSSVKEGVS
jgi:tryptophan synthase alpha chain